MKNHAFKRFLSLLMAISLVLSCGILSVSAEDTEKTCEHSYENGVCIHCNENKPCTLELTCDAPAHVVECLSQATCTCTILCSETMCCPVCEAHGECKGQPETQPDPAVCNGTENCTAASHDTTCACYNPCAALGCTEDTHHADCPKGQPEKKPEPAVCDGSENCTAASHNPTCACYDPCAALGCTENVHHADCPKGQPEKKPEPAVCDGTENCTAASHNPTCACYDPCAALGCTEDTHHADCPYGPCTKTEGCKLVKNHEGACTGMTTYPSPVTDPVAKIGETGYTSLKEALANAVENDVIILHKDVVLGTNGEDAAINTGDKITLDLNRKTLKGPMVGTLKMNGGTYYTTDTFKMVVPTASTGNDKSAYVSSDAVFLIAADGITIVSGNVSLDQSMGTQEGHKLTVNSGASFTVPQNMELLIRKGSVTVNGTLVNNGRIELAADATLTGNISGTVKFSGGTYKTPGSTKAMVAPTEAIFNTSDATLKLAGGNPAITVVSGSVTQGNNKVSIAANNTLTIKTGATYTIPSGKTLAISGSVVAETGATLSSSGSIELADKNATLVAPTGLTVTTSVAHHHVEYAEGTYKVVENAHVLVNKFGATIPYYYGSGSGEYTNFEAVFKAVAPATFTLTQNETFNSNVIMSSVNTTSINLNGHTLSGTGSITSGGNLEIKEVGKVSGVNGDTYHNLLLGAGDKIAFTSGGAFLVTVAADNSLTYGSFNMTEVYPSNSYTKVCYMEAKTDKTNATVMTFNTDGTYSATDSLLLQDPSTNGKPSYYMTAVKNNTTLSHSFVYGSTAEMTFESNAFFSGLTKVTVTKGTTVKELTLTTHYTAKKGSTIVTLKNSYLKTLAKGDYVVKLYFQDGNSVSANLYVVAAPKAASNPQTGDMILTSVVIMVAAAAGIGGLIYVGKKKKN